MKLFPISLVISLLVSIQVSAKVIEPLKDFLTNEIQRISDAVNNPTLDVASTPEGQKDEDSMYFRRFCLRLTALVGFDVVVGSVTAMPEVELLWQRDLPDGWEPYKP